MKNLVLFSGLIFILAVGCNNPTQDSQKVNNSTIMQAENLIKVEFDVQGMTCTGCESTVVSGVSGLDGIDSVSASFVKGKVQVRFDSTMVDTEAIQAEISKKGYKVTGSAMVTPD